MHKCIHKKPGSMTVSALSISTSSVFILLYLDNKDDLERQQLFVQMIIDAIFHLLGDEEKHDDITKLLLRYKRLNKTLFVSRFIPYANEQRAN